MKAAVAVGILCVFLMSDSDVFFSVVSLAGARRLCLEPLPALRTGVGPSCQHPVVFFNRNVQMNSPLYVPIVSLGANQQAPGLKLRWAYYMQWPSEMGAWTLGHVLWPEAAPASLLPQVSLSPQLWHTAQQLSVQSLLSCAICNLNKSCYK